MKFYPAITSFATGEMSPVLYGRVDLAAYQTGAKELTNFIVLPQGGLINRPGTTVIFTGTYANGARLIPFVFSENVAYVLMYSIGGSVRVYNTEGIYLWQFTAYSYTEDQLKHIRWLQSADIIYIFHPNVQTQKISRYGENTWTYKLVDFENGPYQDANENRTGSIYTGDLRKLNMRITGSGTATYVESSEAFFSSSHVGLLFKIEFLVKPVSGNREFWRRYNGTAWVSDPIMFFGATTISSTGGAFGTIKIWRKRPDDSDFVEVFTRSSDSSFSFSYQENVEKYGTYFKIDWLQHGSDGYATYTIHWSSAGGIIARQARLTSYISTTRMLASAVVPAGEAEVTTDTGWSNDWQFGAFGGSLGYPSIGIFHQERLVLANSTSQRQTIWMSKSASWEDFGTTIPTEDTDSILVTLASKEVDDIVGLSSREDLVILTIGGEWVARTGKQSDIFTPSSILITPSTYHGAHSIAPLEIGSNIMFVQRHGRAVRGMGYSIDVDGYASSEISVLSAHLFDNASIVRWSYQQDPWSVIWIVLSSGEVLALTIQEEHKVTAWARCKFATPIIDVCCVPGNGQDEVFFLARNETQNTKLLKLNRRIDSGDDLKQEVFLDELTLPYTSSLECLEIEENANGSLQGRFKQVPRVSVRVYKTSGFHAGVVTENNKLVDQIKFDGQLSPEYLDTPFTGDVTISVPGGTSRQARVRIENREPYPITITGIYPTVDISGEK